VVSDPVAERAGDFPLRRRICFLVHALTGSTPHHASASPRRSISGNRLGGGINRLWRFNVSISCFGFMTNNRTALRDYGIALTSPSGRVYLQPPLRSNFTAIAGTCRPRRPYWVTPWCGSRRHGQILRRISSWRFYGKLAYRLESSTSSMSDGAKNLPTCAFRIPTLRRTFHRFDGGFDSIVERVGARRYRSYPRLVGETGGKNFVQPCKAPISTAWFARRS